MELTLIEYQRLFGHPLIGDSPVDTEAGVPLPILSPVTDNGGPFRAFRFETYIAQLPELRHV